MAAERGQDLHVCESCELVDENHRLKAQLETLHERAAETEALFQRLQAWEFQLLGIDSLPQLLECMTGDLRERFQVDQARLLLPDEDRRIRSLLDANEAKPPPDLLFARPLSDWLDLREPQLAVLDDAGLPPLFDANGPVRSVALLPLVREQRFFGLLALGSRDATRYTADLQTHALARLAAICVVCLENAVNRARLEQGGLTDALTGLHNRRSLEQRLQTEVDRARGARRPLSCLFLDLDLFKEINDCYGHSAGDAVLREVACRLRSTLRGGDVAARFGGDELAVLLPGVSQRDAKAMAERILAVISGEPLKLDDGVLIPLSLSIGVGSLEHDQLTEDVAYSGQELLRVADSALYEAKRGGRGRVA